MNLSNNAPIVLFVFNRIDHTKKTIEALKKNILAIESELFIFSDGAKNEKDIEKVKNVRNYINTISGFKKITIITRKKNWGLARSIIDGVTQIVNQFGKVIVLEDDLVTSPFFLKYMNSALEIYKSNHSVISIHGYFFPIDNMKNVPETFFIKGADCWGWGTWKRGWDLFESDGQKLLNKIKMKGLEKEANFNNSYNYTGMLKNQINGKINSWAIRWYMSALVNEKLTLYPKISFIRNIGHDGSGTHSVANEKFIVEDLSKEIFLVESDLNVCENIEARTYIEKYFNRSNKNLLLKLFIYVKNKLSRRNYD
jgi:hypothetical protein